MLDTLNDVVTMSLNLSRIVGDASGSFIGGDMYCPKCGDVRRMFVKSIHSSTRFINTASNVSQQLVNSLYAYSCVQCATAFTSLIYAGPDGPELAVFQTCRGGLTTPHTPPGVAFYLDQAQRAQGVGAYSAAIAMFRSALDHLLFEQGFKEGMLGTKIANLETAIKAGNAPKWATELDTQFLGIIKDLGNASIHPNDGNVHRQSAIHNGLIAAVKETFMALLFSVYELASLKANRLAALERAKARMLRK